MFTTHARTHTHTHKHTHTHTHTNTHTHTHTHTHTQTHTHTHTHSHTPSHTFTDPLNHTHAQHTHSVTHSLTHTLTHSPTHTHHRVNIPDTPNQLTPLTHSLTHSPTHTHHVHMLNTLTPSCTLTLTHSLTHSPTHTRHRLNVLDTPNHINVLFRRGSRFRYSGHTLRQTMDSEVRKQHDFQRFQFHIFAHKLSRKNSYNAYMYVCEIHISLKIYFFSAITFMYMVFVFITCLYVCFYMFFLFYLLLFTFLVCFFVVLFVTLVCLFVVYRSHSARVQKFSYENYAPGYVPAVDSFRRRPGIRAPTAQQQAPPTRQIFVERDVSRPAGYK